MRFGSQKMRPPHEDELEWTRFALFGSVMRVNESGLIGSGSRHTIHRGDVRVVVPINDVYGIGVGTSVFYRKSRYDDANYRGQSQWNPELRLYVSRNWR